jgi:hypothetical protein
MFRYRTIYRLLSRCNGLFEISPGGARTALPAAASASLCSPAALSARLIAWAAQSVQAVADPVSLGGASARRPRLEHGASGGRLPLQRHHHSAQTKNRTIAAIRMIPPTITTHAATW